jgi:Caenorhabditis protein of unknown function, DUF268
MRDAYPQLLDRSHSTPYDPHYFHQSIWAARWIANERPTEHVDVGSLALFAGMVSVHVPVTFVDIRPPDPPLLCFRSLRGSLQTLPFTDQSTESLSCLHVVEHVGLGRYGDRLDSEGTRQACSELERILAPGGTLYLSTPVGRERVCFNAHRIHDPRTILGYLPELELVDFEVVDDDGFHRQDLGVDRCTTMSYGCGLFRLRRSG